MAYEEMMVYYLHMPFLLYFFNIFLYHLILKDNTFWNNLDFFILLHSNDSQIKEWPCNQNKEKSRL